VPATGKDAPSFNTGSEDHLKLAMTFIDSLNEYSEVEIVERINHHLSKWIKEREPDEDWIADPLFGRLPDRLGLAKGRATLSRLVFRDADVAMLRETMWIRDIAQQLVSRPVGDVALVEWLTDQQQTLGTETVLDLGVAYRLFDWVMRNIQTEPTVTSADGLIYNQRMAWEALLLGRGDVLLKSRIFILLARQRGIPVVMLAVDQDDQDATPWLPAAWINQQLYLFDMELGLPVPADGESGIATLARAVDNPALLESLVTGDGYRVGSEDLKRIVALIDATPEYLSQRMKLVELALTAENKMKLTCRPSILSKELRRDKGITNVGLWPLPYDSIQARLSLRNNPAALAAIQRETSVLAGQTPIARGRLQHFRGELASSPSVEGAKKLYMQSRMSDEQIAALGNADEQLRVLLQARELPTDPQARARLAETLQNQMRNVKEMASYWLGILAFEQGQYEVAANFFDKRVIKPFPKGQYHSGAIYNLGRTFERWGRGDAETEPDTSLLTQAIEAYESIGNVALAPTCQLRAARLKKLTE
jgi:tetratricopeptide (TPR) repeat protein